MTRWDIGKGANVRARGGAADLQARACQGKRVTSKPLPMGSVMDSTPGRFPPCATSGERVRNILSATTIPPSRIGQSMSARSKGACWGRLCAASARTKSTNAAKPSRDRVSRASACRAGSISSESRRPPASRAAAASAMVEIPLEPPISTSRLAVIPAARAWRNSAPGGSRLRWRWLCGSPLASYSSFLVQRRWISKRSGLLSI
jgi:hypothetical protein